MSQSIELRSRDSSVDTATGYGWTSGVHFPAGAIFFSSPQFPGGFWGHPPPYAIGIRALFLLPIYGVSCSLWTLSRKDREPNYRTVRFLIKELHTLCQMQYVTTEDKNGNKVML
jgi:hypothetical protein